MTGYIHSTESFGTVDGPGIRFVVFMQGCPMRCLYCHNPDTWELGGGKAVTAEELIGEFEKNRAFYKNGGITVSGGEPLLQTEFVTELFRLARERGIHTCLDTSGIGYSEESEESKRRVTELMKYTDIVMLDVKHIDPVSHKRLTGRENHGILAFAKFIDSLGVEIWIRHVVVAGYTDGEGDLFALGEFIGRLKNLKALDVLPYHTLGVAKYRELGIPYPLDGLAPLDKSAAAEARKIILDGIRKARAKA